MSDFMTIKAKIKEILDELKVVNDNIAVVYDYHESNLAAFPAVTFESESLDPNVMASTSENQRTFIFRIVIHQEYEKLGRKEASDRVDVVVDEIMTAFDEDFSLGGVVDMVSPVTGNKENSDDAAGEKITFTIFLACQAPSVVNTCS